MNNYSKLVLRNHTLAPICILGLAALCLMLAPATAAAQHLDARMQASARAANIGKTKTVFYAIDLTTGNALVRQNIDNPMIPASNLKLITTATALHTLGKHKMPTAMPALIALNGSNEPPLIHCSEGLITSTAKKPSTTVGIPAITSKVGLSQDRIRCDANSLK